MDSLQNSIISSLIYEILGYNLKLSELSHLWNVVSSLLHDCVEPC